jgi:ribonuclease HIII
MSAAHSFTFALDPEQQNTLLHVLTTGNFRPVTVPHARYAVEGDHLRVTLFTTGKCLVQGARAEEFVQFTLEPLVLKTVGLGYEAILDPKRFEPHIGVDESGKGDFFGPLVIAAVYVDEGLAHALTEIGVRDSKSIASATRIRTLARAIRDRVGERWAIVAIGPRRYNELYAKIRNVNRLLAWGHARAIENVLERVPDCPRALADQFGHQALLKQALLKRGRGIALEQRTKAESDPAVAAASILARERFLDALRALTAQYGLPFPRGASEAVHQAAVGLVARHGPAALWDTAKCHFKTADEVLAETGYRRSDLPTADAGSPKDPPTFSV